MFHCLFIVLKIPLFSMPPSHAGKCRQQHRYQEMFSKISSQEIFLHLA
jgi:hypothetical protein